MNELIEKFGQVAWEAAMRQVQIDIVFTIILGVVLAGAGLAIYFLFRKVAVEAGDLAVLRVLLLVLVLLSLLPFSLAVKQSLNPEFYAIEKFIPGKR